jgi:hypothetical protein
MALTITDDEITSDEVSAFAVRHHSDHGTGWVVSTYDPKRVFTRDQAISALTLAEEQNRPEPNRLLVESLESELR